MQIDPANNLHLLEGCYSPEWEPDGPFVWAPSRFELRLPRKTHTIGLNLAYLGERGAIRLFRGDACVDEVSLREGWQECFLNVADDIDRLRLEVGPLPEVRGDDRQLGVMIRSITLLDEGPDLALRRSVAENAVLNDAEYRQGETRLASYPPYLRVTSEVRCNIPETSQACTYCAWDWAKSMEMGAPAFTPDTLDQLQGFYANAHSIGDCSIGEPTMNVRLGEILSRFDRDGKRFSFTTNGQLLVERVRRQLLGKDVDLYVSIDSASAQGFKRYRNDRFDKIIANLRLLCNERRQHGDLPRVIASFIAMRSNIEEIEAYFALMKEVGVDFIKVRSLYLDDNLAPVVTNNGYRFDYYSEVLSNEELADFAARARICAASNDLPVYVEWDQFEPEAVAENDRPLCAEPWKSLYVLSRGIMPCCYATEPLARWQEQGERSLDEFLRDVFNSDEYQTLRRELAAGRLAPYCANTPSCPVAKRRAEQRPLAHPIHSPMTSEPLTTHATTKMPVPSMKAVLIQTSDAVQYAPMLAITARTTREFCRRHGLEYRPFVGVKSGQFPWHSTYNRIHMMAELSKEQYQGWVLYLDADAYIYDLDFPILDYLKENDRFAAIAVRANPAAEFWDINAGVLFLNFGHPLGRRIASELAERFAIASRAPEFNENQWPDPDLRLDDQGLLNNALIENPRWQDSIKYEPQTLMNSLHASFVRHHLRAMTPDFEARVRSIEIEVDEALRKSST